MSVWKCRRCEFTADELWEGRCPFCKRFYRAIKIGPETKEQKNRSSFAVEEEEDQVKYIPTGFRGFDDAIGGGLVEGCTILFGGFKGYGKTTLLVQVANAMAARRKVVYFSSEQTKKALKQVARRVGARNDVIVYGAQRNIEDALAHAKSERAFLAIYDSLQKFIHPAHAGMMGAAQQSNAVATAIKDDCAARGSCAIVVNQMSTDGTLKGGEGVGHDLDTVIILSAIDPHDDEAPRGHRVSTIVIEKNRNGADSRKTYWQMTEEGVMVQLEKKSKLIEFPSRLKYHRRDEELED